MVYEEDELTQEQEFELLGLRVDGPLEEEVADLFDEDDLDFLSDSEDTHE